MRHLVRAPARRPPLINRGMPALPSAVPPCLLLISGQWMYMPGYYARVGIIDLVLRRFLTQAATISSSGSTTCGVQIVALGGGMATTFFRLHVTQQPPSLPPSSHPRTRQQQYFSRIQHCHLFTLCADTNIPGPARVQAPSALCGAGSGRLCAAKGGHCVEVQSPQGAPRRHGCRSHQRYRHQSGSREASNTL